MVTPLPSLPIGGLDRPGAHLAGLPSPQAASPEVIVSRKADRNLCPSGLQHLTVSCEKSLTICYR